MTRHTGRTTICSIVFVDIVGFSKVANAEQLIMKECLEEVIAEAVSGLAEHDCVIVDSGDGAAICFPGDPEDALFVATAIRNGVAATPREAAQALRIGINLGPIKLITDLNGATNIVGDGMNVAQRIMSFASDGEVLVSRSYYEVVSRLRESNEHLFHYMGVRKDKHIREHELYAVESDGIESRASITSPAKRPPEPRPKSATSWVGLVLQPPWIDIEERRLARYVGPLARIIVRRASKTTGYCGAFLEALAKAIPDVAKRKAFLGEERHYLTQSLEPQSVQSDSPKSADQEQSLSETDLATLEHQLAQQIGPIAHAVIRRESKHTKNRQHLCKRVATSIADPDRRRRFLDSLAQ